MYLDETRSRSALHVGRTTITHASSSRPRKGYASHAKVSHENCSGYFHALLREGRYPVHAQPQRAAEQSLRGLND
jgi:hypothetical protein